MATNSESGSPERSEASNLYLIYGRQKEGSTYRTRLYERLERRTCMKYSSARRRVFSGTLWICMETYAIVVWERK